MAGIIGGKAAQLENIEESIHAFKTELLLKRPFYGDILMRIPIVRDDSCATACTDGRSIRWNGRFFAGLNREQRGYVLMHEVFHLLLMHPARRQDRDPEVWNVAADMIVNSMCDALAKDLRKLSGPHLMRPANGVFVPVDTGDTAEALYGRMTEHCRKSPDRRLVVKNDYRSYRYARAGEISVRPDQDLIGNAHLSSSEKRELERMIQNLVRSAASVDRGTMGSFYVPNQIIELVRAKPLPWRQLLKEHLSEVISDDTSYATPERKYLHMDLILPGHSLSEEGEPEEVWAFVDSSGSIGQEDLNLFLTQLYRLVREFHCELNVCYWDTQVTDVYRKIRKEKQVLDCRPQHSGGTDINCVYTWMAREHVRPGVMLILTDGYFGTVSPENRKQLRPRDTLLVLCNQSQNPECAKIGRVCRLDKETDR